jgi:translation initiation factor IF-2
LQQTKDNKEKVRVFALARVLGVDSKTIIDICKGLGFDVKSQLASLEPEQVDALKQRLAKGPKAAPLEPAKAPPTVAIPPKDKKIVNLAKPRLDARAEAELPPAETAPAAVVRAEPISSAPLVAAETAPPEAEPAPLPVAPVEAPIAAVTAAPTSAPIVAAEPVALPPAPVAAAPSMPTAAPPVGNSGPSRVPTLASRPPNMAGRPPTLDRPRPPVIPPRAPAGTGGAPPAAKAPPVIPPRPGVGLPPRTGPAGPAPAGGGPGQQPPLRHRRSESDRKPGATAQPGQRPVGDKDKKPVAGGPLKFTPEQLQALREGRSVTDVLKKPAAGAPGVVPGQAPAKTEDGEELDEEGKKKHGPGKVVGRDVRHADRAKRQEQRKVRQKDVVVQDGKAEVIEEEHGSKRGRRAAMLKKRLRQPGTVERKGKVPITLPITVRSLSSAIRMKVGELVLKLKDLTNVLYNINSTIDTEVAELIATETGLEFEIIRPKSAEEDLLAIHVLAGDDQTKLEPRAPVVTIMGHVDHGKTSLLDKIRESNVVATEAGGITQVIRAWRVIHNGKPITFLDTPGHEAFTKMRARGANVTDIVVIVVAANDGVMPQTEEAIAHAKAAGVSIVVAINKVDLPDANIKRTEQQLYGLGLIPDTMGGDCQFVHTSATKGTGVPELLDTLSLVAEVKELKANSHKPAMGTCLEAYLSGDEGVMATVLVQQGTLHRGDVILCGACYGRVRAMYDDLGRPLEQAGPSVPVRITGLDDAPNADDHFHVVAELAKAREIAEKRKERALAAHFKPRDAIKLETLGEKKQVKIAELKVVLKAEARGSIEAIRKELEKLVHEEVRVRLLHAGIGAITESDVQLALASPDDTIVVGFNVVPDDQALRLADERGVPIREYNIIYKLTEDIKASLEGKLKPREEIHHLGRALVREVFKISRVGTVAGCHVTTGVIERSSKVRVIRDGAVVYPPPEKTASLDSLKRFKDDVKEVREGYDCGLRIVGFDDIKVNDVIEAYRVEQVQRTL